MFDDDIVCAEWNNVIGLVKIDPRFTSFTKICAQNDYCKGDGRIGKMAFTINFVHRPYNSCVSTATWHYVRADTVTVAVL